MFFGRWKATLRGLFCKNILIEFQSIQRAKLSTCKYLHFYNLNYPSQKISELFHHQILSWVSRSNSDTKVLEERQLKVQRAWKSSSLPTKGSGTSGEIQPWSNLFSGWAPILIQSRKTWDLRGAGSLRHLIIENHANTNPWTP